MASERYSVEVLRDCITLQNKKGADYQSSVSEIKQAEYYLHGAWTLYDTMHAKMLRLKSVLAKAEAGQDLNFESIKDSCMDLINYASFLAAYVDGKMDGQDPTRDIFNKPKPTVTIMSPSTVTVTFADNLGYAKS